MMQTTSSVTAKQIAEFFEFNFIASLFTKICGYNTFSLRLIVNKIEGIEKCIILLQK